MREALGFACQAGRIATRPSYDAAALMLRAVHTGRWFS
jgi:hypothetical protein